MDLSTEITTSNHERASKHGRGIINSPSELYMAEYVMRYNGNRHGQLILSVTNEKQNVIDDNYIFCPTK